MEEKIKTLDPMDYYMNLSKKDKNKYISYLMVTYDLNYNTIRRKLRGTNGYSLNTLERIACREAIKNEILWRY